MINLFLVFLRLGMTSFGGPVAHLSFFRAEFVERKAWMSEKDYADLVALCQFLPGPASSQVGLAVGYYQGSYVGAFIAWLGFTLPSALLMVLFALGINHYHIPIGALLGLKLVAVAVVAQAILAMGRSFCRELKTIIIALSAALLLIFSPNYLVQFLVIIVGGLLGLFFVKPVARITNKAIEASIRPPNNALVFLLVFFFLLIVLPILAKQSGNQALLLFDIFYRVGSLVFGGGHVVLPMLQAELVPQGIVNTDQFLAGYGAAQAVPGPLFTFAGFLGAVTPTIQSSWFGGLICLVAIFLPSFLLVLACLPYWDHLREYTAVQAALVGVNAAVVGVLVAAFYQPMLLSSISSGYHVLFGLLAFVALQQFKLPSWLVVILGALMGALFF